MMYSSVMSVGLDFPLLKSKNNFIWHPHLLNHSLLLKESQLVIRWRRHVGWRGEAVISEVISSATH